METESLSITARSDDHHMETIESFVRPIREVNKAKTQNNFSQEQGPLMQGQIMNPLLTQTVPTLPLRKNSRLEYLEQLKLDHLKRQPSKPQYKDYKAEPPANKLCTNKVFYEVIENYLENDIEQMSDSRSYADSVHLFDDSMRSDGNHSAQSEQLNTGIYKVSEQTRYPILEGVWLQNDYLAFVTLDVDDNKIYLELFKLSDNQLARKGKRFLFDRNNADAWSISIDKTRKFICFFLYSWQSETDSESPHVAGYFINAPLLIETLSKKKSVGHRSREAPVREFRVDKIIQEALGKHIIEINYVIEEDTSKNDQAELKLVLTCFESPANEVCNSPDKRSPAKLQPAKIQKSFFTASISETQNLKPKVDCALIKHDFQEDEQDVVGFFSFGELQAVAVLDSGETILCKQTGAEKHAKLILPFAKIKTSQMTSEKHLPRLIIQSFDRQIAVFDFQANQWLPIFTIPGFSYDLQKVFGSFIIAAHPESFNLKLFETSDEATPPIVTELELHSTQKAQQLDACLLDQMSVLRYDSFNRTFDFSKLNNSRIVIHSQEDFLEQSCGSDPHYLVQLKKDLTRGFIEIFHPEMLTPVLNNAKPFVLPKLDFQMASFAAYLIPTTSLIMLDIKPLISHRFQTVPFQCLLVLDTKTLAVKTVNCQNLPITLFCWLTKSKVMCQTLSEISEFKLVEDKENQTYKLEQKQKFGPSKMRVQLADVIQLATSEHLVLKEHKIYSSIELKTIFTIDIKHISNQDFDPDLQLKEPTFILRTKVDEQDIFLSSSEQQIYTCFDPELRTFFAIVASDDFALLFKHQNWNGSKKVMVDHCQVLPIKKADHIKVINSDQVAVYSSLAIVVVNHTKPTVSLKDLMSKKDILLHDLDFKILFESPILQVCITNNIIGVIYGTQSLRAVVGHVQDKQVKHGTVWSFNDLAARYQECLQVFGIQGYISLCEANGRWNEHTSTRLTPINVNAADLLTLQGEQQGFDKTVLLQHLHLNKFTIWEGMIRVGLWHNKIQINEHQLPRVLRPVLGDLNRSLVHHFCSQNSKNLREIFQMQGFDDYYSQFDEKSPIFFDFRSKTPLQLALDIRDFDSFYALIGVLLKYQNKIRNFYLVSQFIIPSIEKGLDIDLLLESDICSYKIDSAEMEYIDTFPAFHTDFDTAIANYSDSFQEFCHSKETYKELFGDKFPVSEDENKLKVVQKEFELLIGVEEKKKRPIEYIAMRYPFGQSDQAKCSAEVSRFLYILSKTERSAVFRTRYIQKFVEFQWKSPLKNTFSIVLGLYLASFVLILLASTCCSGFRGSEYEGDRLRMILMLFDALLMFVSVGLFEFRQMMAQKGEYFKSFWNYNDISVFLLSISLAVCEVSYFITHANKPEEEVQHGVVNVIIDSGEVEIKVDPLQKQILRVQYSAMILSNFFKILNVAQVYPSIGYLVKMLGQIAIEAIPFLVFFMYVNFTFTFIFYAIDITFDETNSKDPMGEYQGIGSFWFLPYLLYTFRQSLGDFKTDCFLFLPAPQLTTVWLLWLTCILINSMIFLNFLIVTIEGVYEVVKETQNEQATQKKTEILKDLDDVFGQYIDALPVNILVVRQTIDSDEREEEHDENEHGFESLRNELHQQHQDFVSSLAAIKSATLSELGALKQMITEKKKNEAVESGLY